MRKIFLLVSLFLFQFSCSQKIEHKKEFEEIVTQFIKAYNNQDTKIINNMINPKIGLYIFDTYYRQVRYINTDKIMFKPYGVKIDETKFNLNDITFGHHNFNLSYLPLHFVDSFKYTHCDNNMLPKGFFTTPFGFDVFIEELLLKKQSYDEEYGFEMSDNFFKDLESIKQLQKNSKKVFYVENYTLLNNDEEKYIFNFYFTYINEKWYLTILELTSMDCTA